MKRILISVEALAHDYIQELELPFLAKKMEAHPAVSFGLGSRPAAAALMGGMLPVCQIPQCGHRIVRYNWADPYFLTHMKHLTERQFFLTANGWMLEIVLPWMSYDQRIRNFEWSNNPGKCPSQEIVEYFLASTKELDSYFGYLHLYESHYPWFYPGKPEPLYDPGDRETAVRYVDGLVAKVFNARKDEAEIVICSDHNEPPRKVSAAEDVPSPKTMLSFFVCNDLAKNGKRVYLGNEWAQQQWIKKNINL